MDVANQSAVQKRFSFRPELVPAFLLSLGVGDQGRDQLQNVLLAVNVSEGVIVHGFFEIDRVKNLDLVPVAPQEMSGVDHDVAFSLGLSRTECGNFEKIRMRPVPGE